MLKHIKEYSSDDMDLLGKMRDLGLSPKPHCYYVTTRSSDDDGGPGGEAICIISKDIFGVAAALSEIFGVFDEVEEPDFEDHVLEYKNLEGLLDHISDNFLSNGSFIEFNTWELTPRNKTIPEDPIFETEPLGNPVKCYEIGDSHFSDFRDQLKSNPYGNL